jgi:hypothetical protein
MDWLSEYEEVDLGRMVFLLVDVYGLGHDPGDPVPELPTLFLERLHRLQGEIIRDHIRPTLDAVRLVGLPVVYTENLWRPSGWDNSEFGRLCLRTEMGGGKSFDEIYIGSYYNRYSKVIAPLASDIVVVAVHSCETPRCGFMPPPGAARAAPL